MTIKRLGAGPAISRSVEHAGIVYLSGMTAENTSVGMGDQTRQVLDRIEKALAEAGTDKSRLLAATVYIADMSQKEDMNEAWKRWIDPANPPARATIEAKLGSPTTLVEIMVTAAK